jgi:hypothetical protein
VSALKVELDTCDKTHNIDANIAQPCQSLNIDNEKEPHFQLHTANKDAMKNFVPFVTSNEPARSTGKTKLSTILPDLSFKIMAPLVALKMKTQLD